AELYSTGTAGRQLGTIAFAIARSTTSRDGPSETSTHTVWPSCQNTAVTPSRSYFIARSIMAQWFARLRRTEESLTVLERFLPALERAPVWAYGLTMACGAATTLWLLQRTDHIEVIARNVHDKVLVPDFRWPMYDGRLSMAHLCALQGRYDEAVDW